MPTLWVHISYPQHTPLGSSYQICDNDSNNEVSKDKGSNCDKYDKINGSYFKVATLLVGYEKWHPLIAVCTGWDGITSSSSVIPIQPSWVTQIKRENIPANDIESETSREGMTLAIIIHLTWAESSKVLWTVVSKYGQPNNGENEHIDQ